MTSAGDDDPVSIGKHKFGKIKLFFFSKVDVFISISPGLTQKFNLTNGMHCIITTN